MEARCSVDADANAGSEGEDNLSPRSLDTDDEYRQRYLEEDEREEERRHREPDEEGKYHDDPLWYGKSLEQIRYATELEKSNGNAASRNGEWKKANRYWKNALKGAEKLSDLDTEVRLRLNLVLGYIQRGKPDKALEHCDKLFCERLKSAAAKAPGLLAKAHYRRAEAHILAGNEAIAVRALRAVLSIEPGNVGARKRLLELRKEEQERRARERALFSGKLPAAAEAAKEDEEQVNGSSFDADAEERASSSCPKKTQEEAHDVLTDREASSRLAQALTRGEDLNFQVGKPFSFGTAVTC